MSLAIFMIVLIVLLIAYAVTLRITDPSKKTKPGMDKLPYFYEVVHPLIVNGFDKTKPLGVFSTDAKTFHLKKGCIIIITDYMSSWSSTSHGPIVSCVGGYLSNGVPIHFPVDRCYCVKKLNQIENVPEMVRTDRISFMPHEKKVVASLFKVTNWLRLCSKHNNVNKEVL